MPFFSVSFLLSSLLQKERASAVDRAEELQKQRDELHRDHDKLRKALTLDLQKKVMCNVCFWWAGSICLPFIIIIIITS